MKNLLNKFFKDESGATAIEYGLIAALVSVAIIGGVTTIGSESAESFTTVGTAITAANDA
ncbi:Flp family type IVb pilin [Hirschia maritima]|uniref:Flp family type IVb pilin n=1 Tax=Hirschia maritima TaxID=1121961 RepID=UPI0003A6E85B